MPNEAYTRLFHVWLEPVYAARLNGTQLSIVLWVARHSFGMMGRKVTKYSWYRIAEDIKRSLPNVSREGKRLLGQGILKLDEKGQLGINKHAGEWLLSSCEAATIARPQPFSCAGATKTVVGTQPFLDGVKKERKEKETFIAGQGATDLKNLLEELLTRNGVKNPPDGHGGLKAADKLLRLDKRPLEEAKAVLRWSQDSAFWRSNILSIGKFREKYETLRLQMQGDRSKPMNGGRTNGNEHIYS